MITSSSKSICCAVVIKPIFLPIRAGIVFLIISEISISALALIKSIGIGKSLILGIFVWPICKTKSMPKFLNSELIVSQAPKHGSADIIILSFVLFSKNSTNLEKCDFNPYGTCKTTRL